MRAFLCAGTNQEVGDALEILELRTAVAGAPPGVIWQILEQRLPGVAAPSTSIEFDAWTWALYDLGLAAETLPEPAVALDLYARSIEYNRTSELLRSAALVRSGLCLEQLGRWLEAMDAYRQAESGSAGWPESRALLFWRLGRLQRASGDYADASETFGKLLDLLPQPGIPALEAELEYASCLECAGQVEQAEARLTVLAGQPHPAAVEALLRLAALNLRSGKTHDAADALRRITSHPAAEVNLRAAASIRLGQLGVV